MLYKNIILILLGFLFLSLVKVEAQVTIGSLDAPYTGALLDLKTKTDGTAEKGVAFPRVELLRETIALNENLSQTIKGNDGSEDWDKDLHVGLMVYHTGICTLKGEGLYVWTGNEWSKLGVNSRMGITFEGGDVHHLLGGSDARHSNFIYNSTFGNRVADGKFVVNWSGTTETKWRLIQSGATDEDPIQFYGLSGVEGPLDSNPYEWKFKYGAMPEKEFSFAASDAARDVNTWRKSRYSILEIEDKICGKPGDVVKLHIHQMTHALLVDGRSRSAAIHLTEAEEGEDIKFDVVSNIRWNARYENVFARKPLIDMANSTLPPSGGVNYTKMTSTAAPDPTQVILKTNVSKDIADKYNRGRLIYRDADAEENPNHVKRVDDIVVSVTNCPIEAADGTILRWAGIVGFTEDDIKGVSSTQSSRIIPGTLYQLHRDQNNNYFLSGDFGAAGRWMIHNLAATSFAAERTQGVIDTKIYYPLSDGFESGPYDNIKVDKYPRYVYPLNDRDGFPPRQTIEVGLLNFNKPQLYKDNERMGLMYNWAGATNSKTLYNYYNNTVITTNVDYKFEGEDVGQTEDPQKAKFQGICPTGWYLPSDWEWTELEQELMTNASLYSQSPNLDIKLNVGLWDRMEGMANIFFDMCPPQNKAAFSNPPHNPNPGYPANGVSNPIGEGIRPGFNVMSVGRAISLGAKKPGLPADDPSQPRPMSQNYNSVSSFWTSSGSPKELSLSMTRTMNTELPYFARRSWSRESGYFQVRCKKMP